MGRRPVVKLRRDLLPECADCRLKHQPDPTGKECLSAVKARMEALRRIAKTEMARRSWSEAMLAKAEREVMEILGEKRRKQRWDFLTPDSRAYWMANAEKQLLQQEGASKHRHLWRKSLGSPQEKGYRVRCGVCGASAFKYWQQFGGGVEIEHAPVTLEKVEKPKTANERQNST